MSPRLVCERDHIRLLSASSPSRLGDGSPIERPQSFWRPISRSLPQARLSLCQFPRHPGSSLPRPGRSPFGHRTRWWALLQRSFEDRSPAGGLDHSATRERAWPQNRMKSNLPAPGEMDQSEALLPPHPGGTFTWRCDDRSARFSSQSRQNFQGNLQSLLHRPDHLWHSPLQKNSRELPAAPEPVGEPVHFYEDGDLETMSTDASLSLVRVEHPDLFEYAKKSGGNLEADLQLFSGKDGFNCYR